MEAHNAEGLLPSGPVYVAFQGDLVGLYRI